MDTRHGHGSIVGEPSLHVLSPSLTFGAVSTTTRSGLRNLVEIRELIEVGVVGKLAGALTDQALDRLAELCDEMTHSGLDPDADREFHRVLYAGADNPLIGQLVDVFWDAYRAAQAVLDPPGRGDTAETVARHRLIVDALRAGDADVARTAMHDHFAEIKKRLDDSSPDDRRRR
ncbi:FCD domain-containing protein [Pseudonocardia sp. KRD291]|uniref:FadR/GntR family transcriptional regulator n=1 Tax=Pseudonocardia sp. KRD291 TaxID=2792007 RepID=UPI0027E38018|nr:FCD domain-containing protein [Pseudonocardia sp. KRD291]